jgi:hypothetical protein
MSDLKGLYTIALNMDRERGDLHANRNFHFFYYDAIAEGIHVKEFLREYEGWIISQMDRDNCENSVGFVS